MSSSSSVVPDLKSLSDLLWNEALIRRYDLTGPRYTSYPTALEFNEQYDLVAFADDAVTSRKLDNDLSLYVHLPFCAHLCYYCACNKVVTKRRERALPYLRRVIEEARLQTRLFGRDRPVRQLHLGGGTPTFLSSEELTQLIEGLAEYFNLQVEGERDYSVEIDPREVGEDTLATLRELGFNRVSLGVQDLDKAVQKAVNRIQPRAMTERVLKEARRLGFGSINMDLIYGLPLQTPTSFARTLETVLAMGPDRLSLFSYAHLPKRFFPQTRIKAEELPTPQDKLAIMHHAIERLLQAGYVYIGMDHFARPEDPLAVAQRNGQLHRNFQGYTTHGDCDLVGLGVSAIGQTESAYFQNQHDLGAYETAIDTGQLAIARGRRLERDDQIRRWVIMQLICQFRLDKYEFARRWGCDFNDYFGPERARLKPMVNDGLLKDGEDEIEVLPAGRLLIRAICQMFDRYRGLQSASRFSRII